MHRASDKAFASARQEIGPKCVQCPRCSAWMRREDCWNQRRGACRQCAPDLGAEMAAAQASRSVEEAWARAKMSEEDKHLAEQDRREGMVAACPMCGTRLQPGVGLYNECGSPSL